MVQGIQGQDNQDLRLRQLAQQYANEALQQRSPEVKQQQGQDQGLQQLTDARQLSDELIEEISGKDESTKTSDLSTLVTSLKEMADSRVGDKMQEGSRDAAGASQARPDQAQGAAGAGDKKKKEVECLKVDWNPLMKEDEVIDEGNSWGRFDITREKKEIDVPSEEDGKGEGQGMKLLNGLLERAFGGQGNAGGAGQSGAAAGKLDELPKGSDGKTPVIAGGANPLDGSPKDDKGAGGAALSVGPNGKAYVQDSKTGEKQEIPEHGELKALHPMKIKNVGQAGELKPGATLFSYEDPQPGEKARKNQQAAPGTDEAQEKPLYEMQKK